MKKKVIFIYIIFLTNILSTANLMAQETKISIDPPQKDEPLIRNVEIGVDIWGVGEKLLGSDYVSGSASVNVNLKNRFFPALELGYGKINTINEDNGISYKTGAPFFKIGADYNFFYKKPYLPGYLYGGLRIAHSSFSYDVSAPAMTDPTWGNITIPFDYKGVKGSTTWTELVVGLKASIFKRFYMGWSIRYRVILNNKKTDNTEPLYIPGYGMSNSSKFGVTYNLIYNLPL